MKEYDDALKFWNDYFNSDECDKESFSPENLVFKDERIMAEIKKTSAQKKILDYGCGHGILSFMLLNDGAPSVTALEPSPKAIECVRKVADLRGDGDKITLLNGFQDMLDKYADGAFDGLVSCNVLDVVPQTVCVDILEHVSRVLRPGTKGFIMINSAPSEEFLKKRNAVLAKDENGNDIADHYVIGGVLRIVNKSDEFWLSLFRKYFKAEYVGVVDASFKGDEGSYPERLYVIEK